MRCFETIKFSHEATSLRHTAGQAVLARPWFSAGSPRFARGFPSFDAERPVSPHPSGRPRGLVALGTHPCLDGWSSRVTLQSAGRQNGAASPTSRGHVRVRGELAGELAVAAAS